MAVCLVAQLAGVVGVQIPMWLIDATCKDSNYSKDLTQKQNAVRAILNAMVATTKASAGGDAGGSDMMEEFVSMVYADTNYPHKICAATNEISQPLTDLFYSTLLMVLAQINICMSARGAYIYTQTRISEKKISERRLSEVNKSKMVLSANYAKLDAKHQRQITKVREQHIKDMQMVRNQAYLNGHATGKTDAQMVLHHAVNTAMHDSASTSATSPRTPASTQSPRSGYGGGINVSAQQD